MTYGYDADGNQTSITDPRGTVTLEYDELHRLTRKKHNGTAIASYSYDGTQASNAVGRLVTEKDGDFTSSADKTDYTYDVMGRVKTANRTVSGTVYAMEYFYDFLGNVTEIRYPSASGIRRKVTYAYNTAGELDRATDATGTAFDYVTAATYSALGSIQQIDFANGVRTTLGWNKNSEITSILTQKLGGATHLSLSYTYFANGQIQERADLLSNLKSEKYTYDQPRCLFTSQRGPDTNIQVKYQYDYDRYGNRWGKVILAGSGYGSQLGFNTANNRVNSAGFSYDNSGNVTAANLGMTFSYDQENFMLAAGSTQYKYDAQGRRVRKTVGSTVTDYFYWGEVVISEKQGSAWTDYIFFGAQRIAKQTGTNLSTTTFLHADHLGSTRVCTNSSGNSAGACDYEPFGEYPPPGPSACTIPTNYRFAGMEWDSEISGHGLYHTWFRQYDPTQGRWMAVDPVPGNPEDPQSPNRYIYVLNDPINLLDPLGLGPCGSQCKQIIDPETEKIKCDCPAPDPSSPLVAPDGCLDVYLDGIRIGNTCDRPLSVQQQCVQPNFLQRIVITGLGFWARRTGLTFGLGAGASGGIGNFMGVTASFSRQLVVSPNGKAAFVDTTGTNALPLGPTWGKGAYGGIQVSASNAKDPQQLSGLSVNAGIGGGKGAAIGLDGSLGKGSIKQGNLTLGVGYGGIGQAFTYQVSGVTPICPTN